MKIYRAMAEVKTGEATLVEEEKELDLYDNYERVCLVEDIAQALELLNDGIDKRIDIWKEVHKKADTNDRKEGCEAIINVLYDVKKLTEETFPAFAKKVEE